MQYDYYSCPYEPDTGIPPCGEMPECQTCSWRYLADSENQNDGGGHTSDHRHHFSYHAIVCIDKKAVLFLCDTLKRSRGTAI